MPLSELKGHILSAGISIFFTAEERRRYDRPAAQRSLLTRLLVKTMLRERLGADFNYTDFSILNDSRGVPVLTCRRHDFADRLLSLGCSSILLSFSHTRSHAGAFIIYS